MTKITSFVQLVSRHAATAATTALLLAVIAGPHLQGAQATWGRHRPGKGGDKGDKGSDKECTPASGSGAGGITVEPQNVTASNLLLWGGNARPGNRNGDNFTDSRFTNPAGLLQLNNGTVVVADTDNHCLRAVDNSTDPRSVWTLAGVCGTSGWDNGALLTAKFNRPLGLALSDDGTRIFVSEDQYVIRDVNLATGQVSVLAGRLFFSGVAEGQGDNARFLALLGLGAHRSHSVMYAADGHSIRKVTANGTVTNLAGSAVTPGSTDGSLAAARFNSPTGIAVSADGKVYVADRNNHVIRLISNGTVYTIAGTASTAGFRDGVGAEARFNNPVSLALDASERFLFIADQENHRVRTLHLETRTVSTMVGAGGMNTAIAPQPLIANISQPRGVATGLNGTLLIAPEHMVVRVNISVPARVVRTPAPTEPCQSAAPSVGAAAASAVATLVVAAAALL